jgi:UDP-2,3-diacylglucosamine pyrophosphatase LpxH
LSVGYDAVVLSDLHLRAGPSDDFRFDAHLERLLAQVWGDGCREVILNGDIVDFVAMWAESPLHPDPGLGLTEAEAVTRLWAVGEEHRRAMEALARFVRDGGRCVFLVGNHDWEMHWPKVQALLLEMLGDPRGERVKFVLHGEAYKPLGEAVHVEHGHQLVGDQNFFHEPRRPVRDDPMGGAPRLEQPIGNWLVRSLVTPVEERFPFVNNVRPFTKIKWVGLDENLPRLLSMVGENLVRTLKDGRIKERLLDLALSNPPFRDVFGVGRAQWDATRPAWMPSDLAGALGEDSSIPLRLAARRHLQLSPSTRWIILGHSHEVIGAEHEVNDGFSKRKRGYLNPGTWNPCKVLGEDATPLSVEALLRGISYPYRLHFVRVRGGAGREPEAWLENFESGEVWMGA